MLTTTSKDSKSPEREPTRGVKKPSRLVRPSVPMMLFNAPLTSSKRFSTRLASAEASTVWRTARMEVLLSAEIWAVAPVTAVVMELTADWYARAAVAFCSAVESELMPAAVESVCVLVFTT